jgi:hypothetical protein
MNPPGIAADAGLVPAAIAFGVLNSPAELSTTPRSPPAPRNATAYGDTSAAVGVPVAAGVVADAIGDDTSDPPTNAPAATAATSKRTDLIHGLSAIGNARHTPR